MKKDGFGIFNSRLDYWCCMYVVDEKIEPNNKIYPVWVLFVALMFTAYSFYRWFCIQ